MASRQVTQSGKDQSGDITALCGVWGRSDKATAIRDIDSNTHFYFVMVAGAGVAVKVVSGPRGRYLRTDPDRTTRNNLDDLPNC